MQSKLLLVVITFAQFLAADPQCDPTDTRSDLGPGQCETTYRCRGKDSIATIPGSPPTKKPCDFTVVTYGPDGMVRNECCTKNKPTENQKPIEPVPPPPDPKRPRCGRKFEFLECDPDNGFGACCSAEGYCGSGEEYCGHGDGGCNTICSKCPRPREDGRCGEKFDGATCDPDGEFGGCCSKNGFCGRTAKHCSVQNGCQSGCTPYPGPNRCGKDFGGKACDPQADFGGCCSKHGFCGTTPKHCDATLGCQSGCNKGEGTKPPAVKPSRRCEEDPDLDCEDDGSEKPSPPSPPGPSEGGKKPCVPIKDKTKPVTVDEEDEDYVWACLCNEGERPQKQRLSGSRQGQNDVNGCPAIESAQQLVEGAEYKYHCGKRLSSAPSQAGISARTARECAAKCSTDEKCKALDWSPEKKCNLYTNAEDPPSQAAPGWLTLVRSLDAGSRVGGGGGEQTGLIATSCNNIWHHEKFVRPAPAKSPRCYEPEPWPILPFRYAVVAPGCKIEVVKTGYPQRGFIYDWPGHAMSAEPRSDTNYPLPPKDEFCPIDRPETCIARNYPRYVSYTTFYEDNSYTGTRFRVLGGPGPDDWINKEKCEAHTEFHFSWRIVPDSRQSAWDYQN